VVVDGSALCHPCAHGGYYKNANEITWPDMNWTPVSGEQIAASSVQKSEVRDQTSEVRGKADL